MRERTGVVLPAGFFVSLAEDANRGMRGDDEAEWRDRLDAELANLRAAHGWLLEQGNARQALRLVGALTLYGHIGGVSEVYGWAEEAAERFSGMEHPELAIAWSEAATGACIRGDLTRAQAFCELSEAAAGDDPVADHRHTHVAAILRLFGGDFEGAARLFRRSADLGALVGDDYFRLYALGDCALALAYAGRTDEACAVADEAMELATRRGNASMRAAAYYYAGEIRLENEPVRAAELLEQSLAEATAARNRHRLGVAGLSAISLQARTGEPHAALARYPDLIEHWQRAGAWSYQWVTIRTLIETLTRAGYAEPAAVLHGALTASSTATPVIGADALRLATVVETLRRELGDDAFVQYQSRGAALGDAGALSYALETLRTMTPGDQAW